MDSTLTASKILEWKIGKAKGLPASVEEGNREEIEKLGWDNTDVLFSFLGIYAIGVWVFNKQNCRARFNLDINPNKILVLRDEWNRVENENGYIYVPASGNTGIKEGQKINWSTYWQILGSKNFLMTLQQSNDGKLQVDELNKVMKSFAEVYFDIGNVIPMWPGGNTLRGNQNNGFMDIPELFFKKYFEWYNVLIKKYSNIYLSDPIMNPEGSEFKSLRVFLDSLKSEDEYKKYVEHIVNVIKERTDKINNELKAGHF